VSKEPKWTVELSPEAVQTILDWANKDGPSAELAAQAKHCTDQLEL